MSLHLVKLCVGAASIEDLAEWQAARLADMRRAKSKPQLFHATFQAPRRQEELLDGGSLYWVIRGTIQARQRLVGFAEGQKKDGTPCCHLLLDTALVSVRPVPRRAFQGWRYLDAADAPPDLEGASADGLAGMPAGMRRELAELGLI
ncbi:MAG: DUF1489 family protein [Hyphomicrobiaceae bacterium]